MLELLLVVIIVVIILLIHITTSSCEVASLSKLLIKLILIEIITRIIESLLLISQTTSTDSIVWSFKMIISGRTILLVGVKCEASWLLLILWLWWISLSRIAFCLSI